MQIPVDSNHNIEVSYTDGVAHIVNDANLQTVVELLTAYNVASAVKTYYQRTMWKDLNVGTDSMAVEIVGHIVPSKVLTLIQNAYVPQAIKDQAAAILLHTAVIDSGDSAHDGNRGFWDIIVSIGLSTPICSLL